MTSKIKINQNRFYKSCETFVTKLYKSHPPIYRALHTIILRYKKKPSDLLDNFQKLIELIRNDKTLILEMNKLLHANLKIQFPNSLSDVEKARKAQFESKIQDCFNILRNKNPMKLDRIIEYLKENAKQNQDPLDLAEKLLKQFKDILSDEHELYNEMSKILNEFVTSERRKKETELEQEGFFEDNANDSLYGPSLIKNKVSKSIRPSKKILINSSNYSYNQTHIHGENNEIGENSNNFNHSAGNYASITNNTIPVAMKNEWQFFENIKMKMSHSNYEDLIKCIYLYIECVISSYDLFIMVKDLFKDYEMFFIFRDIMLSRENSRRKTTPFFKPSGEIDLSSTHKIFIN